MLHSYVSRLFVFLALTLLAFNPSAKAQTNNSGFAVALIDMQEGFYARGGTTDSIGLKDLVRNQARLLTWAVQKKIPVVVFEYENYGKTDPRLIKIIANHQYKVIEKNMDGAFDGKSASESVSTLKAWNVDVLIVAGINGPYCVKSTIMGALDAGFDVMTTSWVIGDINHNPPTFPSGSWMYGDSRLVVFPTLDSIIK